MHRELTRAGAAAALVRLVRIPVSMRSAEDGKQMALVIQVMEAMERWGG
jgi:hypothetical protein